MALRYYANAPATTLSASCTSGATSIQVTSVTGLPISYPYTLIIDRGLSTEEAVSVTAAAGTTLTVTRGIDSTTAFAHSISASVVHGITAQDVREPNSHVNASTAVHGISGAVVGTTDTQTLSGKTLTTPTIASFTNATHNHTNAAGGGQITDAALSAAVTVAKGGTGATTLTSGNFLQGNGASAVTATKVVPAGEVVGTTDTQTLTNKTFDSTSVSAFNPAGMIAMTAAAAAPTGWFLCDGAAVNRTTYAALFSAIGTTYGVGDGSTTFNLPNLKGRVPVGRDAAQTEFDTLGETGGAKTHTLLEAEIPSHTHATPFNSTTNDGSPTYGLTVASGYAGRVAVTVGGVKANTDAGTGGGGAHNNLQPYIALNYIIKS